MEKETKTEITNTLYLKHEDFRELLCTHFKIEAVKDFKVHFQAPGGGNYADAILDVNEGCFNGDPLKSGVRVTWKESSL